MNGPAASDPMPSPRGALRLALLIAVAAALIAAYRLGLVRVFADPHRAARAIADLGPSGYVAFVVAYALLQPFGVPGTVFVLVAPLIWPWPIAFALSMTGTMAASVIGFSFARFLARDWFLRVVPARFRKYDDALAARAFATVFLLRFIFWMPPLLHAFFGVSKVGFATHFWGSFFGYLVPLFLVSYFGQRLFDLLASTPPGAWVAIGVAALALAFTAWARRRRSLRADPAGRRG